MNLHFLYSHTLELYHAALSDTRPSDAVMQEYFRSHKYLGSRDRKFISETFYGTLREEIFIEALSRPALAGLGLPMKFVPMVNLFFYSLQKNSFAPKEVTQAFLEITNLSAENFTALETHFSTSRALNDVDDSKRFSLLHSFPDWITDELRRDRSDAEIAALYTAMNEQAPLTLRTNTFLTSRDALRERLLSEGFPTEPGKLSPHALLADRRRAVTEYQSFRDGFFEVQDEGSQLISLLLNPKPGTKILDACAGAGGKTLHLAALMKNKGEVYAYDAHVRRFGNITQRIKKSRLQNIRLLESPEKWARFSKELTGKVDGVLIDSPCSGSGTMRRNPDLKRRLSPETVERLTVEQSTILTDYAQMVKPGGTLVYATCSVFKRENETVVEKFLAEDARFRLVPVADAVAEMKVEFDTKPLAVRFAGQPMMTLLPQLDGTDGFFAAVLQRVR